jgi:hypothetical protein
MPAPIVVMHEGRETTFVELSERYGITVAALRQRWLVGDMGARLVRRPQGEVERAPVPLPVDPAMRVLIDRWNAAVFGVGVTP